MEPPRTVYLEHASEFGEWETARRAPMPALRHYVRGYTGYSERTAFTRRVQAPNGDAVIIIGFGEPLVTIDPRRPADGGSQPHRAFISGIWEGHVVVESPGGVASGLQVDLTPIGAHLFSGLPAHLLANTNLELDDVFGAHAAALCDRLAAAPTWEARFDVLDAVICARLAAARTPERAITWAWRRLAAERGGITISALAEEVGYSRKQLAAQFHEHVGVPPKAVARILRFGAVLGRLREPGTVNWACLAHDAGYYDQAHFARDFREFAGSTPGEFLRRKLPGDGGFSGD